MRTPCDTRFRQQLGQQATLGEAAALLAEYAGTLGWGLAAFHPDMDRNGLPRTASGEFVAVAMGWSADYVKAWVDQRMGLDCPVTRRCGRSMDPFVWDCDPDSDAWKDTPLSGEQRRILKSYKDSVHGDGAVTVPVHRPGGKTGYVSWFSRDPGSLLRRYRDTWRDTYLISHAFITRVDALEGAARRREATAAADTLSLREIECLSWAARGKTEEDIGTILGRSRETVHFHLGNASRKLGASNRTHAVAIACALGLIHLF